MSHPQVAITHHPETRTGKAAAGDEGPAEASPRSECVGRQHETFYLRETCCCPAVAVLKAYLGSIQPGGDSSVVRAPDS